MKLFENTLAVRSEPFDKLRTGYAAPAAKSKSKLGASPVAFDFAALRSGRTGKAPQPVRKCTNLLWSDLASELLKIHSDIPIALGRDFNKTYPAEDARQYTYLKSLS